MIRGDEGGLCFTQASNPCAKVIFVSTLQVPVGQQRAAADYTGTSLKFFHALGFKKVPPLSIFQSHNQIPSTPATPCFPGVLLQVTGLCSFSKTTGFLLDSPNWLFSLFSCVTTFIQFAWQHSWWRSLLLQCSKHVQSSRLCRFWSAVSWLSQKPTCPKQCHCQGKKGLCKYIYGGIHEAYALNWVWHEVDLFSCCHVLLYILAHGCPKLWNTSLLQDRKEASHKIGKRSYNHFVK